MSRKRQTARLVVLFVPGHGGEETLFIELPSYPTHASGPSADTATQSSSPGIYSGDVDIRPCKTFRCRLVDSGATVHRFVSAFGGHTLHVPSLS